MIQKRLLQSHSVFLLLAMLILGSGCRMNSPLLKNLKAGEVSWVTYSNTNLWYTITYPAVFEPEVYDDGNVLFRYGSGVPVLVRYTDEKTGRKRGAWFGHQPVAPITLGGRKGNKFIYEHWDGPFVSRTVSYVVEHRGKFLALEFRTPDELYEIQRRMLASFTFPVE